MKSQIPMKRTKTFLNEKMKNKEGTEISEKKSGGVPKLLSQKQIQKIDASLISSSLGSKMKEAPKTTKILGELDDQKDSEDGIDVSFSLSNSSDINDFLETISNKSDEKIDKIEYEGKTKEEGKEEIYKYINEKVNQIQKDVKDFNDENNQLAENLFKDITDKFEVSKPRNNNNNNPLDKTKTTNNKTKSESLSASDERGFKFNMGGEKNNESESKKNYDSGQSKEEKIKSASHERSGIIGSKYASGDNPLKSEVKEILEDGDKAE